MGKLIVMQKQEQVQKQQKPVLVKRSFRKNTVTVNLVNGTAKSSAGNGRVLGFHAPPKF